MKESLMIAVFIIIVFVVLQYIGKNIVMKKMTTSLEEEKYADRVLLCLKYQAF